MFCLATMPRSTRFRPGLLAVLAVAALSCSPPAQQGAAHVTDMAGVLEAVTVANMSQRLLEFEQETCHRFHVLVLQSLEGADLAAYTAQAIKDRQVAPPPLESGLLLTVVVAEGRARIDAGKGLQDIVNSGRADEILKSGAFPLFAEERYDEGIVRALVSLMDEGRRILYPAELRPEHCR